MCAVLCGLSNLKEIELYAKNKSSFFKKEFGIKNIPSKATICRILKAVDGELVG